MKRGELEESIADFTMAVRLSPRNPLHLHHRALAYMDKGDLGRAEHDLNEAIKLAPGYAPALADLGGIWIEQGRVDEGLRRLTKAIGFEPGNIQCLYKNALALLACGQNDGYRHECAELLERVSEMTDDQLSKWLSKTGDARAVGYWAVWTCALAPDAVEDFASAVRLADRLVQADPKRSRYWSARYLTASGAVLYRASRIEEATERLNAAHQLMPSPNELARFIPAYTWYFLAMAHHASGRIDEASRWLARANEWTDKVGNSENYWETSWKLRWNERSTLDLLREEAERILASDTRLPPT